MVIAVRRSAPITSPVKTGEHPVIVDPAMTIVAASRTQVARAAGDPSPAIIVVRNGAERRRIAMRIPSD
jgi:LDH2 family malate/lactate/ureidoglycolate dehydrogenase